MSCDTYLDCDNSRYKVETACLGTGGNASVHKAVDTLTSEVVAVKILKESSLWNGYVTDELLNHQLLRHPYVIGYKGVWPSKSQQSINIVMEFADGGTLLKHVMSHPDRKLPEDEARHFFQQLILALDYCHKRCVPNRDIKLDNILLHKKVPDDQLPMLKLCDWGYSKVTELKAEALCITWPLNPLNLISENKREPYNGKAADMWSCGVCLYAMLIGSFPFTYTPDPSAPENSPKDPYAPQEIYKRIMKESWKRPEVLGLLSQEVQQLLEGLLALDETKRLTIPCVAADDWFKINLDSSITLEANDQLVEQQQENVMADLNSARKIEQLMVSTLGDERGRRRQLSQS
eukprot:gene5281-5516_t